MSTVILQIGSRLHLVNNLLYCTHYLWSARIYNFNCKSFQQSIERTKLCRLDSSNTDNVIDINMLVAGFIIHFSQYILWPAAFYFCHWWRIICWAIYMGSLPDDNLEIVEAYFYIVVTWKVYLVQFWYIDDQWVPHSPYAQRCIN